MDIERRWDRMDYYLSRDDKDGFIKYFKESGIVPNGFFACQVLKFNNNKKCIAALVNGEVSGCPPALTKNLMDVVMMRPNPDTINLLMTKCDGAYYMKHTAVNSYPLPELMSTLRFQSDELSEWSKGDSLIKLIILLCQSGLKNFVESIRIIARYSDCVNEIAWSRLKDGELIGFAALLLVARDKVMAQFDTGMTIKEVFNKEGTAVNGDPNYMSNLEEAYKLLHIFVRVGDNLSTYYASMPKKAAAVKVVIDVLHVFVDAGFSLTKKDLDFSKCFSSRTCAELEKSPAYKFIGSTVGRMPKGYYYDEEKLFPSPLALSDSTSITHSSNVSPRQKNIKFFEDKVGGPFPRHSVGSLIDVPTSSAASMNPARAFSTSQVGGWTKKRGGGGYMVAIQPPRSALKSSVGRALSTTPESSKTIVEVLPVPSFKKQLACMAVYLKKGLKFM